ncbi:MAG: ferric reductase-like transmembrane domain-containing protein, partial [Tabrizicola sp.]|nr:ferric reductase-like transmembrane domain-containing protein [Tabrizicola sp.]
ARLWRPAMPLIPFRREMGIHGCLLAVVHAVIILVGWLEWDLMRLFGFEWHPDLLTYVMLQQGFGLSNALGIAALILTSVLAATSSDAAIRRLGLSGWKFLQMGVLPLWWLTVAHVGYFLFLHFLSFHRATPEPNPLQYWFVGLVVLVLGLRSTAYLRTISAKGGSAPRRKEADHATI